MIQIKDTDQNEEFKGEKDEILVLNLM